MSILDIHAYIYDAYTVDSNYSDHKPNFAKLKKNGVRCNNMLIFQDFNKLHINDIFKAETNLMHVRRSSINSNAFILFNARITFFKLIKKKNNNNSKCF